MTRQYIGARYVPIFFNQNGSNNWIANYHYEPLTIVTYNNVSYTSSQDVPPTIGNPAQNPEYWVPTGNYNGQIEGLQKQINSIPYESHNLNSRHFVMVGDSYFLGQGGTGWRELLPQYLGIDESGYDAATNNDVLLNGVTSNPAFFADTTNHKSFLSQLQSLVSHMSAENILKTTDVIVAGGYNEQILGSTQSTLTGMINFISYCKNTFPNSNVWVFFIANSTSPSSRQNLLNYFPIYLQASKYGGIGINLGDSLYSELLFSDIAHPNNAGISIIVQRMANCLLWGDSSYYPGLIQNNENAHLISDATDIGIPAAAYIGTMVMGKCNEKNIISPLLTIQPSTPITLSNNQAVTILDAPVYAPLINPPYDLLLPVTGYAVGASTFTAIYGSMKYYYKNNVKYVSITLYSPINIDASKILLKSENVHYDYPFI